MQQKLTSDSILNIQIEKGLAYVPLWFGQIHTDELPAAALCSKNGKIGQ